MTTYKEQVHAPGVVRGDGHDNEADCTVSALKISLGSADFTYSAFKMVRLSKPLHDGKYFLFTLGQVLPLRYHLGIWT
jgi:hypothetical protein